MKSTKVIQINRSEVVNSIEARIKEIGVELGYYLVEHYDETSKDYYTTLAGKIKNKVFHYNRGRFEAVQADLLSYDVAINSTVHNLYSQIKKLYK